MELLLAVAVVGLGVWVFHLSGRIRALETGREPSVSKEQVAAPSHWSDTAPVLTTNDGTRSPSTGPGALARFFAWCAQDWLMKLGGLLVVLGVAWFVSYAFANEWIGPKGRVAIGLGAGAAVLVLGRYRLSRYVTQGSIVMVVGALVMLLTTYAAREIHDYFTPLSALVLMFGVSSLLGISAVLFRYRPLAYANAGLAAVAPFLVASPDPSVAGLLSYTLVLLFGALGVVAVTGWRELVLIALGVVTVHSVAVVPFASQGELETGLLFAFAFTALFFLSAASGMCRERSGKLLDVTTALLSGLFLYTWIMLAAPSDWQSTFLISWAVVFALGAQLVFRVTHVPVHFYAYGAVGVVYLATATALLLDGSSLTIAFTLEATALLLLARFVTRRLVTSLYLSGAFIMPILLTLDHITSRAWRDGVFHDDAAALYLMTSVLALVALYFTEVRAEQEDDRSVRNLLVQGFWSIFGVYTVVLVWLITHALLVDDTATLVALVIYALAGCAFYIYGNEQAQPWAQVTGGILVGLVAARLLMIDVWQMALLGRVITFLTIGVLLMAVAWFARSYRRQGSVTSSNQEGHHEQ